MVKVRIGTTLFQIRNELNLTQEEVAYIIGISQSAYGRLEKNEVQISIEKVDEIATLLQVDIADLLQDTLLFISAKSKYQILISKHNS